MSPKDVVEQLWSMATQGELLTPEGWRRASRFYANPGPWPGNGVVHIVSNAWGQPEQMHSEDKPSEAFVGVEFGDAGRMDSLLRYSPPQRTNALKTFMEFHVVVVPAYPVYGPDGKIKGR